MSAEPGRRDCLVGFASGIRTALAVLGCVMPLVGCVSNAPPMRFYVLTAAGGQRSAGAASSGLTAAAAAGAADLRIGRLTIPGELDRPEIVRGLAGNQLQIADQDHWGAPLGDMIRRVLNEDLSRDRTSAAGATGAGDNTGAAPNGERSPTVRTISLEIEQLLPAADCAVALRATWTAAAAPPSSASAPAASPPATSSPASEKAEVAPPRGTIEFRTTASSGACAASDVPAALSAALAELAERLRAAAASG